MDAVTPPGSRIGPWDIVRVDHPYANEAATRRRPALVIAAPDVRQEFGIRWVLMITSARHVRWPFDVPVSELDGTGLSHASVVRTAKIATLDARLAIRIGELSPTNRAEVRANVRQVLDFALKD